MRSAAAAHECRHTGKNRLRLSGGAVLYDALLLNTHGVLNSPLANWFPVFPNAPGINSLLRFSHIRWNREIEMKKWNGME